MANAALESLLPLAGWTPERSQQVEFVGGADPILPTPFRIGESAAAALGAVGLALSDLWALRTGRGQEVTIDARHATATLRGGHYLLVDGSPIDTTANPVFGASQDPWGVYPAKDGRFIYIHASRPRHLAAALQVLDVPQETGPVRRAVAQWDAFALEDAIVGAGGVAGTARTMAEWAAHRQSAALASLPLLEVVKIADGPPEPLPPGDRPLSGVRVLDMTWVLAGPMAARTLAEHGADVLRIAGPHETTDPPLETSHGKLSARLDLREPADAETLRGLIRESDVFVQGYRPGSLARRGFSPEAVAQLRPGIVVVSLSAFGHVGPWAGRRGFDTVVQTVSGISTRQAELFPGPEPGPRFYPASAVDGTTGFLMAFGALVALSRRAREGGTWHVRLSLAQTGRWLVSRGEVPEDALRDVPDDFAADEVAGWSMTTDTPFGRLRHLGPLVHLSETAPRWMLPPVPLGYHEPAWTARPS